MLPCRSSKVCILTAALCFRNLAQGNRDRQRSMVVESNAYKLCSSCNADHVGGMEYGIFVSNGHPLTRWYWGHAPPTMHRSFSR